MHKLYLFPDCFNPRNKQTKKVAKKRCYFLNQIWDMQQFGDLITSKCWFLLLLLFAAGLYIEFNIYGLKHSSDILHIYSLIMLYSNISFGKNDYPKTILYWHLSLATNLISFLPTILQVLKFIYNVSITLIVLSCCFDTFSMFRKVSFFFKRHINMFFCEDKTDQL